MVDFYPNLTEGKPDVDSEWILTDEAAEIMKVTPDMVQLLCRQYRDTNGEKGIKSMKLGRDWLVSREAAEAYDGRNKKKYEK
jgi:hypothetical protein